MMSTCLKQKVMYRSLVEIIHYYIDIEYLFVVMRKLAIILFYNIAKQPTKIQPKEVTARVQLPQDNIPRKVHMS